TIFHKDGQQITDWYNKIYLDGLVDGQSEYYIVEKTHELGKIEKIYYIYKLGSQKSIGPLKEVFDSGFIKDPSKDDITLLTLDGKPKIFTKQEADEFFESKDQGIEQII
ncbi:MAG: hypothetical protein ACP5Q5_11295, partial [Brevinematia bacterium]